MFAGKKCIALFLSLTCVVGFLVLGCQQRSGQDAEAKKAPTEKAATESAAQPRVDDQRKDKVEGQIVELGSETRAGSQTGEETAKVDSTEAGSQPQGQPQGQTAIPPSKETPEQILAAMVQAYRQARSYGDQGRIVMRGTYNGQPIENRTNYVTAFERPNKLRLICGEAVLICDGTQKWGYVPFLPGQVLKVPAPQAITLETLFSDMVLANALMQGPGQVYTLVPPPLILLVADDPLKTLLYRAKPPELIPPGTIGNSTCDRIRLSRSDGDVVLWIDRNTRGLERVDLPVERIRQSLGGQLQSLAIYAEFVDAALNVDIDPAAFQFQPTPESTIVEELHPHGYDRLGSKVGDFEFRDTQGQAVTPQTLAGKPTVLEFWSKNHPYSPVVLSTIQSVADQFQGKVNFYAVNVDNVADTLESSAVTNKELQDLLQSWKVSFPLLRDPRNDAEKHFGAFFRRDLSTVPCLVILNAQGVIQAYHLGSAPDLVDRLAASLEKLQSGVDLVEEEKTGFAKMKQELAQLVAEASKHGLFTFPLDEISAAGTASAAAASEPKTLRLTPLFKCTAIESPSNILLVPASDAEEPRILVVEKGETATELGWDGQVKTRFPLKPVPPDRVDFLAAGSDAKGERVFAAWSLGVQQISFYDEKFQLLCRYPADGSPPHDGVADVHLADLDGDGSLEAVVGFLGLVGVHAVSLDGNRIWGNRTASAAFRVGILEPDAAGHRSVVATNTTRGSVVQISHDGQRLGEIIVPGRTVAWLVAADLDGDGQSELCGLDPKDYGQVEAFGFDLSGNELWHYTLPKGMSQYPIQQVVWGRLLPNKAGQWVMAGADGSVHILDAKGQPVDQFNVGALLTGIAVGQHAGKPALVVATPDTVTAWTLEPR